MGTYTTSTEKRLAEIYSYYVDECYSDDFSGTFAEWLSTSMYGTELAELSEGLFKEAVNEYRGSE